MRMAIAVADAGAKEESQIVEERSIDIRRVAEFVQVLSKQLYVIALNGGTLFHLDRIVLVMGERMMRLADSDLWVRPASLLAAIHERDNPRQIRLIGQQLQVIDQPGVI